MNKIRTLLLAVVALLDGCAFQQDQSALHDFGVPPPSVVQNVLKKPIIQVDSPSWYVDTAIRYRLLYNAPTTIRAYQLDHWIAPPGDLLQHYLLAAGLERDMSLTIRLVDFEQQFLSPRISQVVLHFVAELNNPGTQPVSREFRLQQTTRTADAAGAVDAFAAVVRQGAEQLRQWLVAMSPTKLATPQ